MALGDLHVFTGEEYVDTELAPLLNENFNSLKEYVDDASRWQVMPVQFKGTNAKFLIHETTLGTVTTQVLPLVVLDNTDIAKFSACSLKVVMSTKNGSTVAVNCDISLQKVHNSNECNVNFNTTNSDDAKAEPCTFTYNNIKYAGLKLTTGNADTLWVSGYTTEEWIAPVVNTSVTNLVTLGSDMNVIPTLFKSLQTDKSPVNDYDVVNKKSLNDLTNIKTYSQLSQIGLSGGVLDNSPYAIGNALPANSMLIVGIGGEGNTYNYPSQTGNLTVVRANTNHVFYEITTESGNGYVVNYVLQFTINTASEDTNYVWKRVLTDVDTGYWQPNETVTRDTVRKLVGKQYAGCFLVCKVAGTTGSTQPSPDPADGAGIGGAGNAFSELYLSAYDSSFSDSRTSVWKKVALDSDLTNLRNSLGNAAYSTLLEQPDFPNNSFANKIPVVHADGVMEVGQYLDFHIADSSNYDYDIRLEATKNGLYIGSPSSGGTFGYWTISKGTNGWARESSTGFTIQWGFKDNLSSGNNTISFPRTFSTVYQVVPSFQGTGTNENSGFTENSNPTNSNFSVWVRYGGECRWIAVGVS